ncbi:MAG TPA: hypothetical protein VF659_21750 [Pyrinomonadaceae bacterium]
MLARLIVGPSPAGPANRAAAPSASASGTDITPEASPKAAATACHPPRSLLTSRETLR